MFAFNGARRAGLVASVFFAAGIFAQTAMAQKANGDLVSVSLEQVATLSNQLRDYLATGKTQKQAIIEAQKVVADKLKDPEAARFRNVVVRNYLEGKIICGEVNGKNSYGAYVGYRTFAASAWGAVLESTSSRYAEVDHMANTGLRSACAGEPPPSLVAAPQPAAASAPTASEPEGPPQPTSACSQEVIDRMRGSGLSDGAIRRSCGRR